MNRRFYLGNLAPGATEVGLQDFLVSRGLRVAHVALVGDRSTGKSRGFGFVELEGAGDAASAIRSLEDVRFEGRTFIVRPVEERRPRTA